ncbi:MAG TPA: helix-hairpin-helix domain-containing protein [Blastocatellia bacterium]|nr:helix-hairpin-helix domain-containing protein [Blastocatellia bacterium]
MADNQLIADVFRQIADLMEFKDDNPFKVRSYRTAADTIEDYPQQMADIVRKEGVSGLQEIPAIGKAISAKIVEIINTGTCETFEILKKEVPVTVLDLMRIRGIGHKTARLLYDDFGISNLRDFENFAEGGGLRFVRGISEERVPEILDSVKRVRHELLRR